MNKFKNIEEIEQMLPDFISGTLNENDKKRVEEALNKYPELNNIYLEYKKTFEFVSSVKFEEPPAQYWNTLLPRIHDRLDRKKQSWLWLSSGKVWKVLLPVAALVLIFIVYKMISSPAPEITKDEKLENKTKITDTVKKTQQPEEKVHKQETTEKTITAVKKEKMVKQPKRNTERFKEYIPAEEQKSEKPNEKQIDKIDENQIAKEDSENGRDEELASNEITYNITSSVDEVESMYEESEKEYNNLSTSEKSEVLDKLKGINL